MALDTGGRLTLFRRMSVWKTLSRHTAFDAPPYLRIVREVVEIAPGQVIDDFWQVELRSFAVIVPLLEDGRVATLTSYRHGPRRVCMSMPGGMIDPGETPEAAAARELVEETGLAAARMISLGDFVDNGNQRGCRGHYFLALGCTPVPGRIEDATEAAELVLLPPADVDAALDAGQFGVIHHVAGWCLARRHPEFPAPKA
jgi:ADP-ribose pyrophosphatase